MLKKTLLLAALTAIVVPGTAAAKSGVVVKVDRASALTAVAGAHGAVALVHGATGATLGQKVSFQARTRSNGTLTATAFRVVGSVKRVHVRGVVLAHRTNGYLLSANGAVLAIRMHALRHTQSAADNGAPPTGSSVDVTASISGGELAQQSAQPLLTDARSGAIEGRLVTAPAGTIAVRSQGLTLVLALPAGFDLSKFAVGDEVLASFQRQADGSLLLTALSANSSADDQGDDEGDDQGDDEGDDDGGGSNSGAVITGTVGGSSHGGSGH